MTRSERVAITGIGILTAAGRGADATAAALEAGRSGLGRLTRWTSKRCGHFPVAEVRGVEGRPGIPRTVALGRIALRDALASASLSAPSSGSRARTALVAGTSVGGMPESELLAERLAADPAAESDPAVWSRHECAYTAHALARDARLEGPALTVSSACASGNQAIIVAAELIRCGEADRVAAGGVDALCRLTLNGFASLLAMDPEGCRPFDARRRGMSLGEGAAFLVLERESLARERGARPLAFLLGGGDTCDAHHPTAPDPEGKGAEAALREALEEAGREPRDVDYVNAHGTGTVENDRAEGQAIARLFGARHPPVSSTKRIFGHTLAAAGAVEAVATLLALTRELIPGTCGLEEVDPECAITPQRETSRARPRLALSSSFGFGGSNAVICLARAEDV